MGFSINFGREGNSQDYISDGWSWPEDGFTWMIGAQSTLKIPPEITGPCQVTIRVSPFLHRIRPVQRLRILVNDIKLGQAEFDRVIPGNLITVEIPDGVLNSDAPNELILSHPDFVVPMEVADNGDWRALSLCVFGLTIEAKAALARPPAQRPPEETPIAARFENLGWNCEFGLFQRLCDIEPLGLFRLAGIKIDKLIQMLESDFEHAADAANLTTHLSQNNEYLIEHSVYHFNYHTFIDAKDSTPEKVLAQQGKRLQFLVRKLREDIESGEKIFVFHQGDIEQERIEHLHDLLKARGPAKLLWVSTTDQAEENGSVVKYDSGLLHGRLLKFSPLANIGTIDKAGWEKICRTAWDLAQA